MNEPRENTIKTSAGETHAEDPRADDEQPIKEKADEPGDNPDNRQTLTAEENERFQQALSDAVTVSRTITDSIDRIRQPGINIINQTRAIAEAARCPAIEAMQAIQTAREAIRSPLAETMSAVYEATRGAQEILQRINSMTPNLTSMQNYFRSDEWRNIKESLQEIVIIAPAWLELAEEMEELSPYLEAELKKPEYGGKVIDELLEEAETDENGDPLGTSLFIQALNAARAAREAETTEKTQTAVIKRTNKIDYPLDKLNSYIWDLLEKDTAGQVEFDMSKRGSKQKIPVYYAIDFDDLGGDITITKRLFPFDKRVYLAVGALFDAGNNVITLTKIYNHMGNTGNPGRNDLEKINQSILKMLSAQIYINNEAEATTYKNYSKFVYRGSLLPVEMGEAYNIQGALTNAAIHIFREPPLISFAREKKQITTVDIKLLQSPVSKTNANLQIDDYLIERISKAKHGKGRHCRILFKTLYERAKVKTKKQQQRTPAKVQKYLTHYQGEGFITHFTMEKDGITISW